MSVGTVRRITPVASISALGKARNARDSAIELAEHDYRLACSVAWRKRQEAVNAAKRAYRDSLPHYFGNRGKAK